MRKFIAKYFRPGDFIVLACALAIGFSPVWVARSGRAGSFSVIVDNEIVANVHADRDTIFSVAAPLGQIRIKVCDGCARVAESSCPHKICVNSGKIMYPGQAIVCVPNKLILIADGEPNGDRHDAILR